MQFNNTLLAAGLLLSLITINAQATLTAGTAGGQSVVYSSVSNITWTGDADLLNTMIKDQGYDTVVNAIIAASPVITNTPNIVETPANSGRHIVSTVDFDLNSDFYSHGDGLVLVSWFGAKAFTNYLNSINYAGSNRWALPSVKIGANGVTAHQGNPTDSQFSELFYIELGGTISSDIPNSNYFINEQAWVYWMDAELTNPSYDIASAYASIFMTDVYSEYDHSWLSSAPKQTSYAHAWVASPGNLAAVPVPGAVWLFGTGLAGLIGSRHRRRIE
ncbi:MAG: VPLPA-CTERM sorting domain-containing protein [Methylococcales bacterium]|nr:VPLPA-CTERM sorting domain-containing protein [Methylococcales bacterium]